eukprot:3027228-Rhodomonas_salina.4
MAGTGIGYGPTPSICDDQYWHKLRCYAVSVTGISYPPTPQYPASGSRYTMSSTALRVQQTSAMLLGDCYAQSGTERAYGGTAGPGNA